MGQSGPRKSGLPEHTTPPSVSPVQWACAWLVLAMVCSVVAGLGQSFTGRWFMLQDTYQRVPDWVLLCSLLFWGCAASLTWPPVLGAVASPWIVVFVEATLFRAVGPSLLERLIDGHLLVFVGLCAASVCSLLCHRITRVLWSLFGRFMGWSVAHATSSSTASCRAIVRCWPILLFILLVPLIVRCVSGTTGW